MESGGIDWDVRARRGHRLALLTGWAPAHASSSSAEQRRMAWPGQWQTRKGAFSRVLSLCARSVSTFNLARTPSKIRRTDHSYLVLVGDFSNSTLVFSPSLNYGLIHFDKKNLIK